MRRILKFLRSPARDQLLLMKTLLLLGSIRLALSLLPFRVLDRLLKQFSRTDDRISGTETDRQDADRIAWAVASVCGCIPHATCLTQALTAQFLLLRRGCASKLQIGVSKSAAGRLEAHAWVEYENRVLVGEVRDLRRYKPLFAGDSGNP